MAGVGAQPDDRLKGFPESALAALAPARWLHDPPRQLVSVRPSLAYRPLQPSLARSPGESCNVDFALLAAICSDALFLPMTKLQVDTN